MHIAPFHLVIKNKNVKLDFLGYLTYKSSRRNKDITRVYVNTGAGNEFISEMPPILAENQYTDLYNYMRVIATWMYESGYMEEWFNIDDYEIPNDEDAIWTPKTFLELLKKNGADLRFW